MHRSKILELNESKKYAGRTNIKWIILEIHNTNGSWNSSSKWNRNGITWKEEHVLNNLDSAIGMPIAAEFLDDFTKDEPFGHGLSNVGEDGAVFEDSVVVGTTTKAYISNVELNGEDKRVLIGEGYLYNQRYPNFIRWLKSKMYDSSPPDTSVEISAKENEEYIVYEGNNTGEGRVPSSFDFSGCAILSVKPADPSAIMLELNQEKENIGGNYLMDEVVQLTKDLAKKEVELNSLQEKYNKKKDTVKTLQVDLKEKDKEINSLKKDLSSKDSAINALKKEKESMETELNSLRKFKKETEDNEMISELNEKLASYTEEEKDVAKDKIAEFNQAPSKDKIHQIISEINNEIAKKVVNNRKAEINQSKDDLFGDVFDTSKDISTSIDELI